nr:hypothetical protein [Tanacetum cinerariifolium]
MDQLKEGDQGPIVVMIYRKWDVHNINGRYLRTDFWVPSEAVDVNSKSFYLKQVTGTLYYCRTLTLKITYSCLNDVDEDLKDLAMCDFSYDALCTHWLSLKGVTLLCSVSHFIDIGDTLVETHQTPIVDQPLTSKPQKKQKPRSKQRNKAEVSNDESEDKDHVPSPSSDPLPSGEDSFILNELMVFCTSLQEHVLDLQEAKKIGLGRRVKSPMEKDGLGYQEDASKQRRMIEEIDQNAKIALDDETQGRTNDDEMFEVNYHAGEKVVMETTTGVKDSGAPITDVIEDEVTMAQALAALKSTKPKVVVQNKRRAHSHNVAFVSFKNTSSINETVNAAHDIPAASSKKQSSASSYADDVKT